MKHLLIALTILFAGTTFAPAAPKALIPEELQAAIFYKILGFNKNLKGDITLHVIGNPKIANHFKQIIGRKLGDATLKEVTSGNNLPNGKAHIIYIGKTDDATDILAYCQQNLVMSIAGDEKTVKAGASLGLTVEKGKPKIILGLKGTKNEKINWKAVIFKLSRVIKE